MTTPLLAALLAACSAHPPTVGAAEAVEPPPASPPPAVSEPAKMEINLEETAVATVGDWRVALAKTWEEKRDGRKVPVAWLSVVQKGSTEGAKDHELTVGDTLALGDTTLQVAAIRVGQPGSVTLRAP